MPRQLSDTEIEAFRARVGAVAERLFSECSPDAVTMRQIARELGVSTMTTYRYFPDKDAILAAVRAAAFDRFAAALERAAGAKGGASARAEAVGRAYLAFAFDQPGAYRLMFDINQSDGGRFPDLMRAGCRARKTMTAYIKDLVAAGVLAGDPEMLGRIFWAMVHGLVMLQLAGRLDPKPDFATLHQAAMGLLTRGAAASPRQAKRRVS